MIKYTELCYVQNPRSEFEERSEFEVAKKIINCYKKKLQTFYKIVKFEFLVAALSTDITNLPDNYYVEEKLIDYEQT